MGFELHAVFAGDKRVAQHVIQVQVRVQKVAHCQMVLLYVAGESVFFALVADARVDENRIAGVVAQYKAVHAEGVHDKLLDVHVANIKKRKNQVWILRLRT